MRQFKFRCWDTKKKKMYDVTDIYDISGVGIRARRLRLIGNPDLIYKSRGILQQSTGAKSRDDKDIYEGDIIHQEETNITGIVVWSEGLYQFMVEDLKREEFIGELHNYDYKPKVLGNIYENPELLK